MTYLQRVSRRWAGQDPAAKAQMIRFASLLPGSSNQVQLHRAYHDHLAIFKSGRGRGALTARGTRRKYVPVATVLLE
ncbi:hypothetical protein LL963_20190, partial [Xanthomonas campestris pv. esculenti]|nr:hypothetical protein [Xanthomonas campestris pv. esculenti]